MLNEWNDDISKAPIDELILIYQPQKSKRKWTDGRFCAVQVSKGRWWALGQGERDRQDTLTILPTHWRYLPDKPL
ncbi:MAG: hypothetical protein PHC28_12500 [Flavobacterium sp.]|uniref:hypothetical protein n=1 Tax=Flavobacterium sp. TaxID=239 RepID=UPI00261C787F|nr:hypothetical protein [Flavobacterium sp.]MDD5151272.1 hypothetical protein [Flavobacterium sp.]